MGLTVTSSPIGTDMPFTVKVAVPFSTPTAWTEPIEAMLGVTCAAAGVGGLDLERVVAVGQLHAGIGLAVPAEGMRTGVGFARLRVDDVAVRY